MDGYQTLALIAGLSLAAVYFRPKRARHQLRRFRFSKWTGFSTHFRQPPRPQGYTRQIPKYRCASAGLHARTGLCARLSAI